jgi:hypothetical protein
MGGENAICEIASDQAKFSRFKYLGLSMLKILLEHELDQLQDQEVEDWIEIRRR